MDIIIIKYLNTFPTIVLALIIAGMLYILSKGADILVDEAVGLSVQWGIPKMIIGATIVSLGTTLPEVAVSVFAALKGNPDLALGNAIGSIIADTGLIIGIAAIIGKLPVDKMTIDRQGKVQILAGILLSVVCMPFFLKEGKKVGIIPQWMGWIFLALLVLYIYISLKWAKGSKSEDEEASETQKTAILQILKMFLGIVLVIGSSKVLIPSVEITAIRIGIPQSIIAATLIAFGTSLPELITAITSVRKGHGELAVGNIIGADILNVLFVVGSSASVTRGGLLVPQNFYKIQIPAMLIILMCFRYFCKNKGGDVINKREGLCLTCIYGVYVLLSYVWI
ncbi:sodium:calcium antiporter [Clostridium sp. KNHs214]|uniref:sodium:calcium antiporter n=1 Tax=Clostridium sp. KNHs214 TaxID=1540257 RepID=UPI00055354A9|nr:sodium:calcium antiporter [Clostridium sp. KNHs214]